MTPTTQAGLTVDDLRAMGLTVAVHNDYRLNGKPHTFWLFTDGRGMSYKGEGKTDAEALAQVRASIPAPDADAAELSEAKETWIVEDEDGGPVGVLIDLPDGAQIWSGEVSDNLFKEQGDEAMGSLGGNNAGVFVMSSTGHETKIVCRAASIDDGISIARALAGIHRQAAEIASLRERVAELQKDLDAAIEFPEGKL